MTTTTKTALVYQLANGTFYRHGKRGSFSVAAKPYTRKEITTKNLISASHFSEVAPHVLAEDVPPYSADFMFGGKWIKIKVVITAEVIND